MLPWENCMFKLWTYIYMYFFIYGVKIKIYLKAGKCKDPGQFTNAFKRKEKLAARGQKQRSRVSHACRLPIKLKSNNWKYISKYQRLQAGHKEKGGRRFQQICCLESIVNCPYNSHEVSQTLTRDRAFQGISDEIHWELWRNPLYF